MGWLFDNWPLKLAIIAILCFVAVGALWAYRAGEVMSLNKQMITVLTEKYKAPTESAWKKACEELGIAYDPERKPPMSTDEMKRFIAKWEADETERRTGKPQ